MNKIRLPCHADAMRSVHNNNNLRSEYHIQINEY